jgi:hypothetical protein
MSYCDLCPDYSSDIVAMTFGGFWNEGDRKDIVSWQNTPGVEVSCFHW